MTNIGDIFGFPGEINDAPFDPSRLDSELDRIMATRPIPGAPEGYRSPHPGPQGPAPDGGPAGAVPGAPAPVAPEAPAPPPFNWDTGVASPWPAGQPPAYAPPAPAAPPAQPGSPPVPPAAPAAPPAPAAPVPPAPPAAPPSFWDQLSPLEQQELMLTHQALRDPERQAGVRQAYIGGAQPPAAPPLAPPAAAPAAPLQPAPLPEGLLEGSPEAQMWSMQQEHQRQLEEIRTQVTAQNQATEAETIKRAAESAGTKFANKYGRVLAPQEMQWVAQMAGYQGLPDAFRSSNPRLSYEEAMTQALEFQLRSTDSLLTKVLSAPPAMPPGTVPTAAQPAPGIPAPPATPPVPAAPLAYPGQTPEADARHRYLTALSSAASPSGDVPQRQPISHRADGKLDERSRFSLIQEMTGGGVMGELMGPG